MRNRLVLFGLLFLYQSIAWSDLRLRIVDAQGQPVSNAVVTLKVDVFTEEKMVSESVPVAIMDQVDKQFLPHVLVLKKGQQVVFPNSDQVRHHVYSFSKPNDFEIKLYSGDQADPVRFEYPGIAILGCNIHDQMVAYLYITDTETARVSDAQGLVIFEGQVNDKQQELEVTLWHSQLSSSKLERVKQTLSQQETKDGIWQLQLNLLSDATRTSRKFKPRFQ